MMVLTVITESTIPDELTDADTSTVSNRNTPHAKSKVFIYTDELETDIPYCQQHLRRMEAAGLFPKRVRLGPNKVAWVRSEIDEWVEARKEER